MADIDKLILTLWSPFITEIGSGGPIYFCFHRDFLNNLFTENDISVEDPIKFINECASSFFIIDETDVLLKGNALVRRECGFSPAILFICQQILAAEEMVRDPNGFSEHAYFPRLRKMISDYLPELTKNPFSFDDFESIWLKIAEEIRSVKGNKKSTITFRFGEEHGVNKARSFPLSQALLNREDLLLLIGRIGKEKLLKEKVENIWSLLRSERKILRRRAQAILSLPFLKDRIVEQTLSFARKIDLSQYNLSREIIPENSQDIELKIFKNSIDWISEEFDFLMTKKDAHEPIEDNILIKNILMQLIEQSSFLILPPNDFGDAWIKNNKEYLIEPQETFLILGNYQGFLRAVKIISSLIPGFSESNGTKFSFKNYSGIFVWEIPPHSIRTQAIGPSVRTEQNIPTILPTIASVFKTMEFSI